MSIFDRYLFDLLDIAVTTYLVYYYIINETRKDKENNNV